VVLPDEMELNEDIEHTELLRDPMEEGEEGGVELSGAHTVESCPFISWMICSDDLGRVKGSLELVMSDSTISCK